MCASIVRSLSPEERELQRKQAELADLESQLADRELELATQQATLLRFERHYYQVIGRRYAELDEIEAQAAELLTRQYGGNTAAEERAEQARARANESAAEAGAAAAGPETGDAAALGKFEPSADLRNLYRDVAKAIFPRLADAPDNEVRNELMKRVNRAYQDGNQAELLGIMEEWQARPEAVTEGGVAGELIRVIRRLAQVEERLRQITAELDALQSGTLFQLMRQVEEATAEGRDLLADLAAMLDEQITEGWDRLAGLRRAVGSI